MSPHSATGNVLADCERREVGYRVATFPLGHPEEAERREVAVVLDRYERWKGVLRTRAGGRVSSHIRRKRRDGERTGEVQGLVRDMSSQ